MSRLFYISLLPPIILFLLTGFGWTHEPDTLLLDKKNKVLLDSKVRNVRGSVWPGISFFAFQPEQKTLNLIDISKGYKQPEIFFINKRFRYYVSRNFYVVRHISRIKFNNFKFSIIITQIKLILSKRKTSGKICSNFKFSTFSILFKFLTLF